MKTLGLIVTVIAGVLLLMASEELPRVGDLHAPINEATASTHYITRTYHETTVPNFVTAVLADYRGYDTMFETVVVFIAGMAIMLLIGLHPGWKQRPEIPHHRAPNLIISTTCRVLSPFILVFGFYVIAHGHHSPGGGFQGGVILAAILILMALTHDLERPLNRMPITRLVRLATLGIALYAGTGLTCLLLGQPFLDYAALAKIFPFSPEEARSQGIFWVEMGVAFTVSTTLFSIYAHLSSNGSLKNGL